MKCTEQSKPDTIMEGRVGGCEKSNLWDTFFSLECGFRLDKFCISVKFCEFCNHWIYVKEYLCFR